MPDIDDKTFEQSFAEMVISDLQNRAPALMNYMLGFQLIDKNDEGTRGAGFAGFRLGENLLYVPAFFLAGEIKGTEIMYVKEQDLLIPLEEGWVNYVIQRRPFAIGQPADKDRQGQSISSPDLRRLRVPPSEAKIASDRWAGWAQGGVQMLAKLAEVSTVPVPELPAVLAKHSCTEGFVRQMREDPKLAAAVLRFYEPEDFLKHAAPVEAPATPYKRDDYIKVLEGADALEDPAVAFLSDAEKEQLLRGNTVVVDGRTTTKRRKVYGTRLSQTLANPTEGGCYDILTVGGQPVKAFVLVPHTVGQGGTRDIRMVLDPKTKRYAVIHKSGIYATHQYEAKECEEFAEDLGPKLGDADIELGQEYAIICDCQAYGPFTVEKRIENVDGTTTLMVRSALHCGVTPTADHVNNNGRDEHSLPFDGVLFDDHGAVSLDRAGNTQYNRPHQRQVADWRQYDRIILTDKPLRRVVQSRGVLLVPRAGEFKLVKLEGTFDVESTPASTADLYLGIQKFASELKVWSDGIETYYQHENRVAKAASLVDSYRALLGGLGIDRDSADEIVKTASENPGKPALYYVEKVGAMQFDNPDFNASYDQYFRAPVQQGGLAVQQVPPQYQTADPTGGQQYLHHPDENVAKYKNVYRDDIDSMNQAAEAGQKDVFDASALGALINVGDVNQEIDSYMSDMIKSLDKMGRTLFLMYWHSEELQDRYGKNEYRDLVDDLRNNFKRFGDLVLDLRTKSPGTHDFLSRSVLA